jgi:hypothetical protein
MFLPAGGEDPNDPSGGSNGQSGHLITHFNGVSVQSQALAFCDGFPRSGSDVVNLQRASAVQFAVGPARGSHEHERSAAEAQRRLAGPVWEHPNVDPAAGTPRRGVTGVGANAFNGGTKLTNAVLEAKCTSIGNYDFYNCSSLASVNLPAACTSIGNSAFYNCSSLASVNLPAACTSDRKSVV